MMLRDLLSCCMVVSATGHLFGLGRRHTKQKSHGRSRVLRTVSISDLELRDRFLLFTEYKGSSYVSCLAFSDPGICNTIATLFLHYRNCTIAEIGSLELAHVFLEEVLKGRVQQITSKAAANWLDSNSRHRLFSIKLSKGCVGCRFF